MRTFCLIIFIFDSLIHLFASYTNNQKLRAATKPLIVLSLIAYYCLSISTPSLTLLLALVFSWLGDVLLIPKGLRYFIAGGISFIASHFFFMASFLPNTDFSKIPLWLGILLLCIYIVVAIDVVRRIKVFLHKPLHIPCYMYLTVNALNNCFAFFQLISKPCLATAIVFLGTTCFFISDGILLHVRFKTTTHWKSHFPVMFTYILAEFFITYGMMTIV